MNLDYTISHEKGPLTGNSLLIWRCLQVVIWLIGFGIFLMLIFFPKIGIHAFWNVLIPLAPALFVVATGFWRNVCPLASFALFPRHLGISKKKRLTLKWQGRLHLMGIILLFSIVPLRHVVFDTSGVATAIALFALSSLAFVMGLVFEWKSGWCSGLCPVHPVEKMYGSSVTLKFPNAHCNSCGNCSIPCPDSISANHPLNEARKPINRFAGMLIVGGLPGFIFGWFHVPDFYNGEGWNHLASAYGLPFAGLVLSLGLFYFLYQILPAKRTTLLVKIFATAAVIIYYWYRLPALFGWGLFPGDGMLVNLSSQLPNWTPIAFQLVSLLFFGWWILIRKEVEHSWLQRPPFFKKR